MMSSNSPCAACKLLRRKCTPECIFAPHFPPDQPTKFANVHRVFGASNVAKLLKQLSPEQREDAVVSMVYEAEARLRDPVHGCVGYIYLLQHKLREMQHDLSNAKKELSAYTGPAAFGHFLLHPPPPHATSYHHQLQAGASSRPPTPFGAMGTGMGVVTAASASSTYPTLVQMALSQQHQRQQMAEEMAVAMAAARDQHDMLNSYAQQQSFDRVVSGGATAAGLPAQLLNSSATPFTIDQQRQYAEHPQAQARSEGRSGAGH
ncbi:LOB domain-containing protein 36-like isoform X2 [Canna indica]|uniref:LOB domain-containing protein 36-like isoform X2 n=1 Tax=Canna indica TaxID=4628 RepID=A0AAQ3JMK2_9LILI|nr:LOB domain-containing protein 36-like isoform X2 [Canna indica]